MRRAVFALAALLCSALPGFAAEPAAFPRTTIDTTTSSSRSVIPRARRWRGAAAMHQRRAHAPPAGGTRAHGPALLLKATTSRRTAAEAVFAAPPSRSGEPMAAGRSSDSQARSAACLLAPAAIRRGQWPEATDLDAWSQRRGRPGFAPEFPVCRPRERSRSRPPEPKEKCRGRAGAVKQIDATRRRPQGLPRRVPRAANLAGRGRPARHTAPVARPAFARSAQAVRTALSPRRAQPARGPKKQAAVFKPLDHRRR